MRVKVFHRTEFRMLSVQSNKFLFKKLKHFSSGLFYKYNYINILYISGLLLKHRAYKTIFFSLKIKLEQIYFQNFLNEMPVKYSWFNNIHFLLEGGSMNLSAGQDAYFMVAMSWLFFTTLFKDIYSSPHFPSSSQNRVPRNPHPKPKGECTERN